jgi:hypothetical protein
MWKLLKPFLIALMYLVLGAVKFVFLILVGVLKMVLLSFSNGTNSTYGSANDNVDRNNYV